jgi:hypothetical protein
MERGSDVTEKKAQSEIFSHLGTQWFVTNNEMQYTIVE